MPRAEEARRERVRGAGEGGPVGRPPSRCLLSFRANERHEHSAKTLLGDSDLTGRKGSPSSHSCTGLSE